MDKKQMNNMKEIILPKIVRQEVDDSHYYFVNDEFFPGVTTILDEAAPMAYAMRQWLLRNTKDEADDILAETSGFGTKLHDAYELLMKGSSLSLKNEYKHPKEKKHLASFYQWFEDYKPTDIKAEQVVASLKWKFAGTLDLACKINDRLSIIDYKTGSGIYYSHHLQLLAYKRAYEEMYHVRVKDIYVLRTGTKHKAGYEFKKLEGKKFASFKNVYRTYLDLHDGKIPPPPLMNVYPDEIKLDFSPKVEESKFPSNGKDPIMDIMEKEGKRRADLIDDAAKKLLAEGTNVFYPKEFLELIKPKITTTRKMLKGGGKKHGRISR